MNPSEFLQLKQKISEDGGMQIRVITDSMEPIIKAGDLVCCSPHNNQLNIFDLVIIYSSQRLICHFVFKRKAQDKILTCSYKYLGLDPPEHIDNILGKITSHKLTLFKKAFVWIKILFKSEMNVSNT